MLELGLRDPGNLKQMDFHKYSFSKLAFMLNETSKSENETFFTPWGGGLPYGTDGDAGREFNS